MGLRVAQLNWSPPDFLPRTGIHFCSERPRDELGAKANAEGRVSGRQTVAGDANLVCEQGILRLLVGANWSAGDNEKVAGRFVRQKDTLCILLLGRQGA